MQMIFSCSLIRALKVTKSRYRLTLILGIFIVVTIIIGKTVIVPQYQEQQLKKEEIDSLQNNLQYGEASIASQKAELEYGHGSKNSLLVQFPIDRELEPVLLEFYRLTEEMGLSFRTVQIADHDIVIADSELQKITISWHLEGQYRGFKKMLQEINDLERYASVKSLQFDQANVISYQDKNNRWDDRIVAEIEIEIFYNNLLNSEGRNRVFVEEINRAKVNSRNDLQNIVTVYTNQLINQGSQLPC